MHQIQRVQQQQPETRIVFDENGRAYQVQLFPLDQQIQQVQQPPPEYRHNSKLERIRRERMDRYRNDRANSIGVMLLGGCGFLLCLAVFASAVKPTPPAAPVTNTNPGCLFFCS